MKSRNEKIYSLSYKFYSNMKKYTLLADVLIQQME